MGSFTGVLGSRCLTPTQEIQNTEAGGELPWDQGVDVSDGCMGTGSSLQQLWEQRVGDVSMGWGWSAGKDEAVQGLSFVQTSSADWRGNMTSAGRLEVDQGLPGVRGSKG